MWSQKSNSAGPVIEDEKSPSPNNRDSIICSVFAVAPLLAKGPRPSLNAAIHRRIRVGVWIDELRYLDTVQLTTCKSDVSVSQLYLPVLLSALAHSIVCGYVSVAGRFSYFECYCLLHEEANLSGSSG